MPEPHLVLYVSHRSNLLGAPKSILELIRQLDRNRFTPLVVCREEGALITELQRLGVRVCLLKSRWWFRPPRSVQEVVVFLQSIYSLIRFTVRLVALIRRHHPKLVHVNTLMSVPGAIASRLASRPVVWHIHEIPEPGFRRNVAIMLVEHLADRVVVVSDHVGGLFSNAKKQGRLVRIYNGVDLGQFTAPAGSKPHIRRELGIPSSAPVAVLIGNIIPRKGIHHFIEAAHIVLSDHPGAYFLIVGNAPSHHARYESQVQALMRQYGLDGRALFLGFRTDIPAILQASDVLALASLQDPFPWVLLEAMAMERPVVATDVGGVQEAVVNGETGLIVPPADAEAMAAAIGRLFSEPDVARRLGLAGRRRIEESLTVDRYVDAMQQVYAGLVLQGT